MVWTHPHFNPVAISIGFLSVHWYGIMYLVGFCAGFFLGQYRRRTQPSLGWTKSEVDDILFYIVLGIVVGGRLGYVFIYLPHYYLSHPLEILYIWQGGMSFHGGFLGVLLAMTLFSRKTHKNWLKITDFIAPLIPPGIAAGRLGNFINGELWGRPTDGSWGMIFPNADKVPVPRHPSQLYEMALEGLVLFLILWIFSNKSRPKGAVSGLFLICYGVFRFIIEFTRQPDEFLGLLAWGMSMGQWLSLPMIISGFLLTAWAYRNKTAT